MERLIDPLAKTYWKLSFLLLTSIITVSIVSNYRYQNILLPREHLIGYAELIQDAARSSVIASRTSDPVIAHCESFRALTYVKFVCRFLTSSQIKYISNVNSHEMLDFVSKQHKEMNLNTFNNNNSKH